VAHCDWHIPRGPQAHAVTSIKRIPKAAVCAFWQQALQAIPVDIAAHVRSVCETFPPLLPELLPLPEPLGLADVPPLVLPELLPSLVRPVPPLELAAVPPEPLPLLMTRELLLLGVLPEQPLV
jgi:hypothetical protein